MEWFAENKDAIGALSSLLQGLSILGILVTLYVQRRQEQQTLESERQANRAKVTEAYMKWHEIILANDRNVDLASKIFRRSFNVIGSRDGKIYEEQTRQISLINLLLNILWLEWSYRKTYNLDIGEFFKTVDATMIGFATNQDPEYDNLVYEFGKIFSDFPEEFMVAVQDRLMCLRKSGEEQRKRSTEDG